MALDREAFLTIFASSRGPAPRPSRSEPPTLASSAWWGEGASSSPSSPSASLRAQNLRKAMALSETSLSEELAKAPCYQEETGKCSHATE